MIEGFRDDVLSTLTPGELDFLYYAELHLDDISSWTLDKAAHESLASPAVIERACQKLGLASYSELRYLIRSELNGRSTVASDLAVDYPASQAISDALREADAAAHDLTREAVEEAAGDIVQAERIVVFGRGLSQFPAQYLSEYLEKLGHRNRRYIDPPLAYRDAEAFGSKDCFVIFSAGGRTIAVVKAATIARKNDVPLVAICGSTESPLAKLASVLLHAPADTFRMGQIDLGSRLTQFLAADLVVREIVSSAQGDRLSRP